MAHSRFTLGRFSDVAPPDGNPLHFRMPVITNYGRRIQCGLRNRGTLPLFKQCRMQWGDEGSKNNTGWVTPYASHGIPSIHSWPLQRGAWRI
ncbi:hypothetical protein TNIN_178341 [Trichonephila inaurata madagascariensis]|uniref:Uncharacterized protein n=1 Tax=Trichonephila inaurata madagascariensis TaxID=2747483 RepID=A0A8X6XIH9_9ARAC|nr:hypothetical protein TNIN_178341 [Trichonephila inaurata madagascariensis]